MDRRAVLARLEQKNCHYQGNGEGASADTRVMLLLLLLPHA
jgi:hypothetical protein